MSELNAEAKSFIPPFERYKKYRTLAQIEEIKEYKEKEAKIAAIGKGDELIQREVLDKFKDSSKLYTEETEKEEAKSSSAEIPQKKQEKTQRKRKAPGSGKSKSNECNQRAAGDAPPAIDSEQNRNKDAPHTKYVKPFQYKNANYKKFYDSDARPKSEIRQSKPKFKKHK